MLREPMEPTFAIGQIGLGYEQERDLVVLVVQEIEFEGLEKPATARFWANSCLNTSSQRPYAGSSKPGTPHLPLVRPPLDSEGHFCPRSNGHEKPLWS